jgi:pimeloyl-ACP methyl ester carboxylesterase
MKRAWPWLICGAAVTGAVLAGARWLRRARAERRARIARAQAAARDPRADLGVPLESRYVDAGGLPVHVVIAGPERGPLVLLLHGFPDFWYGWRHQIAPLARAGYRVVAPDQRGYNLTGKQPPYDLATVVADMAALVRALGYTRARVAGHDWGGAVAWSLAARHPELVQRLAILNMPHLTVMARALRGGSLRQMLRSWYIFFFQIPRLPERLLAGNDFLGLERILYAGALRGTFTPVDVEYYKRAWAQPGALPAMLGWYRAMLHPSATRHLRPHAGDARIRVPTLVLWGERDLALCAELAEQSLALVDDGRLVRYPQATHWVHQDLPEDVTARLLEHFGQE